ncbi:LytR/AlgR family response regulator transcription factor [Salinibacter altiplanensis]|uniref:LytR/AlgR family response regulator transcription factor n=1 Tax=Salinibacter altiplanensis TaxID=1803181 RepID=UPI000C9EDF75|nr:LytTR family DNA-binding domain-containing protein [Salinibacter altiplanensis]
MQALIVDDEPPARTLIQEYLEDVDRIEAIGECGNGREAIEAINETAPDLVFLDVQMPGLDGFDVLERIDTLPDIIFSTAYDEYAIAAFEAGAVDYLLKPYTRARFQTAVERALERHDRGDDAYADQLAALLQEARTDAEESPERLYVRHGDKIIPVDPDNIRWIEAAGDYSKLHTDEATYLSSMGIGELDDRLASAQFMRVHRSHILAFPAIDHLYSDGSGGYKAVLDDGTTVRVSRSYASAIRDRLV